VIIVPRLAVPEAELAERIVSGLTDQDGAFRSPILPPGKYYVLATTAANNRSPAFLAQLRAVYSRAKEVELAAGQTVRVALRITRFE
jgi:hypothetical protein